MKIFVGQAVTGENIEKLREESNLISLYALHFLKMEYCTLIEKNDFESKANHDKMKHAFQNLNQFDTFLAIVRSEKRSEGMLMEIGYCIAKGKKIIIAIKKDVKNTYLPEMADKVIRWDSFDDLIKKLKQLK